MGASPPLLGYETESFGPFSKGVITSANPSLGMQGAFKRMRHFITSGQHRLSVRAGVQPTPYTLFGDDNQPVTQILWIGQFLSSVAVVSYSATAQKTFLHTVSPSIQIIGQVWHGQTVAPDVMVVEGLGFLYICHTLAADQNGLYWPTKFWDGSTIPSANTDLPTLMVNAVYSGDPPVLGAGVDAAYFSVIVGFQQALWGCGYGAGAIVGTGFRPEIAKFSQPDFGTFAAPDSITLGNEVRSLRERVVGAGVASESLFLCGPEFITRVTGYGRDSWYKQTISHSYGMVGPKAGCTAGTDFYYWSPRGPMRVSGISYYQGQVVVPQPLFEKIAATLPSVANEQNIVAVFDSDRDSVIWFYDGGGGVRLMVVYDVLRGYFTAVDADVGFLVKCANTVRPVFQSAGTPALGPNGPPSNLSTTNVGLTGATANWQNFAVDLSTDIELATVAAPVLWRVIATAQPGVATMPLPNLNSVPLQWRCRHSKNGLYSAYAGPSAATTFTPGPPAAVPAPTTFAVASVGGANTQPNLFASWTNQASGAVTQLFYSSAGPNGPWTLIGTLPAGVSSAYGYIGIASTFSLAVKHQIGNALSQFSNTFALTIPPGS